MLLATNFGFLKNLLNNKFFDSLKIYTVPDTLPLLLQYYSQTLVYNIA